MYICIFHWLSSTSSFDGMTNVLVTILIQPLTCRLLADTTICVVIEPNVLLIYKALWCVLFRTSKSPPNKQYIRLDAFLRHPVNKCLVFCMTGLLCYVNLHVSTDNWNPHQNIEKCPRIQKLFEILLCWFHKGIWSKMPIDA